MKLRTTTWVRQIILRHSNNGLEKRLVRDLHRALAEIARLEQENSAFKAVGVAQEQRYQDLLKLVEELPILVNWPIDSSVSVPARTIYRLAEFVREG